MTDKFNELLKLSSKQQYEFHLKVNNDKKNIFNIDKDKKTIEITIGDPENKNLNDNINELIKLLQ